MKLQDAEARVVNAARCWLGTPYQHQASLKGIGCDCLGLVRGVWREIEGDEPEKVPAYSSAWSEVNEQEQLFEAGERNFIRTNQSNRRPGDVLLFRMRRRSVAKHLGICSAEQSFIHAYDGVEVVENALDDFWQSCIVAVFRFPSVHWESN